MESQVSKEFQKFNTNKKSNEGNDLYEVSSKDLNIEKFLELCKELKYKQEQISQLQTRFESGQTISLQDQSFLWK